MNRAERLKLGELHELCQEMEAALRLADELSAAVLDDPAGVSSDCSPCRECVSLARIYRKERGLE